MSYSGDAASDTTLVEVNRRSILEKEGGVWRKTRKHRQLNIVVSYSSYSSWCCTVLARVLFQLSPSTSLTPRDFCHEIHHPRMIYLSTNRLPQKLHNSFGTEFRRRRVLSCDKLSVDADLGGPVWWSDEIEWKTVVRMTVPIHPICLPKFVATYHLPFHSSLLALWI